MLIRYTVHSCVKHLVEVPVPYRGRTVMARVDGVVVELVSEDGAHGHTFRLMAEELEAGDLAFLVPGQSVAVGIVCGDPPEQLQGVFSPVTEAPAQPAE
ncbi:MAG TPA: hypothetical protein VGG29_03900 [Caulobacteraceae bacterium]|jgi:hypothetical protein